MGKLKQYKNPHLTGRPRFDPKEKCFSAGYDAGKTTGEAGRILGQQEYLQGGDV